MRTRLLALALTAALLGGCAGAGGSSVLSPAPAHRASTPAPAPTASSAPAVKTSTVVSLHIDGSAGTTVQARKRKPNAGSRSTRYISPATLGVTLSVNGGSLQTFDVSNGSPLCTAGASRSCTLPLAIGAGSATFTMQTFDTAPAGGGSIPGGANLLGSSSVTQTIVANAANSVVFFIGGQVASVSGGTSFASLPSDGTPRNVGVTIIGLDASANTISAGANDPYANPITLSLGETGASGHAYLVVNGSNVGASATLTKSADSVAIAYDGAGVAGYTATLSASALGATPFAFRVSPLYVSSAYVTANTMTFTAAGQVAALSATEANAPASVAYSSAMQGPCWPNAVLSGASGSGASYSVNVMDNNAPANGTGCSFVVSDNLGTTMTVPVVFPVPAQDCAELPAGYQIDPNTVANGSPCPIIVSGAPLTIYTPSDASHPGSGTFTVSERNAGNLSYTGNGSCSSITFNSTLTNSGPMNTSQTYTITATAQTTPNVSCTLNFNDSTQTAPATVIVDPAGTRLGSVSGSQSGTVAYCYLQVLDPGYPCQPGVDNKSIVVQQFPNLTLAPTSPSTALSATVSGSLLSNSNCHWIDIHVQIDPPGYAAVSAGSTAYTMSTELDSGPKTFTVTWYDPAAPTGMYVIQEDAQCAGGPNYQPAVPFGGNGKGSAVVNLNWSYAQ